MYTPNEIQLLVCEELVVIGDAPCTVPDMYKQTFANWRRMKFPFLEITIHIRRIKLLKMGSNEQCLQTLVNIFFVAFFF